MEEREDTLILPSFSSSTGLACFRKFLYSSVCRGVSLKHNRALLSHPAVQQKPCSTYRVFLSAQFFQLQYRQPRTAPKAAGRVLLSSRAGREAFRDCTAQGSALQGCPELTSWLAEPSVVGCGFRRKKKRTVNSYNLILRGKQSPQELKGLLQFFSPSCCFHYFPDTADAFWYLQQTTCSIFTGRYLDRMSEVLRIKHLQGEKLRSDAWMILESLLLIKLCFITIIPHVVKRQSLWYFPSKGLWQSNTRQRPDTHNPHEAILQSPI